MPGCRYKAGRQVYKEIIKDTHFVFVYTEVKNDINRRKKNMVEHPINPVFDKDSKILILGSFPSVKSREANFFYGHPQNRFWKVLSVVFEEDVPSTVEEKRAFLLRNHVAVWDVIHSCDIVGSSDSSIKNVVANDLSIILESAKIEQIFVNGKTAEQYYKKYIEKETGRKAICLPSTSPANAAWNVERLVDVWKQVKDWMQV